MAQTLYDKLWDAHLVEQREDGTALIYIDRHLLHEVTSPQAFEGLVLAGARCGVGARTWRCPTIMSRRWHRNGKEALPRYPTRCRDCNYRRSMIIAKRLTSRRFPE